jgi:hypothetical protein
VAWNTNHPPYNWDTDNSFESEITTTSLVAHEYVLWRALMYASQHGVRLADHLMHSWNFDRLDYGSNYADESCCTAFDTNGSCTAGAKGSAYNGNPDVGGFCHLETDTILFGSYGLADWCCDANHHFPASDPPGPGWEITDDVFGATVVHRDALRINGGRLFLQATDWVNPPQVYMIDLAALGFAPAP